MRFIDTHCHIDGEEFRDDLDAVVTRAREAGVAAIGVPGINLQSIESVKDVCSRYPNYCYPMLGLHPEDVKADWRDVLTAIKPELKGCVSGSVTSLSVFKFAFRLFVSFVVSIFVQNS